MFIILKIIKKSYKDLINYMKSIRFSTRKNKRNEECQTKRKRKKEKEKKKKVSKKKTHYHPPKSTKNISNES